MKILLSWLPLAIVTTILAGTLYITVQQNYRLSANDPQIQMAEDGANELSHEGTVILPNKIVEISQSLAPYIMVFDQNGKQMSSSALLHNKQPELPVGVFSSAKQKMESRFTWEPEAGVRQAVVLRYVAQKGYVLAGRSLKEVESREEMLLGYVFFGWITSLFGSLIAVTLLSFYHTK